MNVRSSVSKEYNDLGVKCASSNIKTENAQSHSFPFSPGGAQQWRPIGPIHLHCEDEFWVKVIKVRVRIVRMSLLEWEIQPMKARIL